jgi:WD40 repeat protein
MNFELINAVQIQDAPYIFDITLNSDNSHAGLSLSSDKVAIHDIHSLQEVAAITDHTSTISSIEFSTVSPFLIHTASLDKRMCMWDVRSPSVPSFMISAQDEVTATAAGLDDSLLAAGVGPDIYFYDIRSCGRPLGVYSDCHTDTVCKLRFHPSTPSLLLSGGEDGLLCTFNTGAAAQDDAVVSIMNTECAVRETGFFGCSPGGGVATQRQQQALEGVFSLSTIETASFWHYSSAQRIGHFPAIRSGVGADYLVNCWHEDSAVFMLAGTNEGGGIICEVSPSSVAVVGGLNSPDGHADTIRCAAYIGQQAGGRTRRFLLSGGEDGRLCLWRGDCEADPTTMGEGVVSPATAGKSSGGSGGSGGSHRSRGGGGGAASQRNKSKNIRYAPY